MSGPLEIISQAIEDSIGVAEGPREEAEAVIRALGNSGWRIVPRLREGVQEDWAKIVLHRQVQHAESVAGGLRRIGNYLANSFRATEDAVALNAQLATLNEAATALEAAAQGARRVA